MAKRPKVCIIGAEGWGSAISTAVCKNVLNGEFDKRVHIYVYDELVRSSYLSEVMNERHENIKYLPGIKLDENLIAVNDLIEAAKEADILIFATSHSFIKPYCNILAGKMKSSAYAVSLIKGLDHIRDGEIDLYSHAISKQLNIPCYSVMSANSAMEMAQGKLCEITIGCNNETHALQLTNLFQTENCKVFSIDDVDGVELCNTLKDLVALSAGFIDGLRLGDNARVACLHLGLKEMMRFIKAFNPTTKLSTFFESCGVANSVASSYADKNVTFAKSFVTSRKTVQEIEANLLNGRKLLGPIIAREIFAFLEKAKMQDKYPLFTILHRICQNEVPPDAIVDTLRKHPDLSCSFITRLQKDEYTMPIADTDSVLENLADTVPEHSSSSSDNVILKHSIDNPLTGFNEEEELLEPYNQYFRIPNSNMELTEFLEKCQKSSMTAVAAIDASRPYDGNVEYSFEIQSGSDKPEIYLKLKDITTNPIVETCESSTEKDKAPWLNPDKDTNQSYINAVGTSNFNTEYQFPKDKARSEYLSVKGQPAEIAGTNVSDGGKPSPIVGLTNLIERHVRPYNEKFKALKVRVKVKSDSKEPVKTTLNTKKNSSTKMHVRKADSKTQSSPVDREPYEEIPGKKPPKPKTKEELLYEKDSTYGVRLLDDEPNVTRLVNMIRANGHRALEDKLIRNSKSANDTEESVNKEKMNDQTNQNVYSTNQGGYTVDYLKVVRSNKKPAVSELQDSKSVDNAASIAPAANKVEAVPLQYSKTDNSYRTTQSDLEAESYSQDELRLFDTEQSKRLDQPQKDDMMNKEGYEEEPSLTLRGSEDQQKLRMAQEFLDEQATFIKNLVMEASSSDTFNDQKKPLYGVEYSNRAEQKDSQLDQEEPKALKSSNNDITIMHYSDNDNKQQIDDHTNIEKDQRLLPSEQDQHVDYLQKLGLEDAIHEAFKFADKSEVLGGDGNEGKDEKPKLVQPSINEEYLRQMLTLGDLEKKDVPLEGHDSDKLANEGIEINSKLKDEQVSMVLIKKNQVHGLEDPNLRFYHGKNDGEQGPEWDWLLESDKFDDTLKKPTKQKRFSSAENTNANQEPPKDSTSMQRMKPSKEIAYKNQSASALPPPPPPPLSIYYQQPKSKSMPIHFEGKELSDVSLQETTPTSTSSSKSQMAKDPIETPKPDSMRSELNAEEPEVMPQEAVQSRKIETTEKYPKVSKIYAEKTEAIPQEDFQNMKIKASKRDHTSSQVYAEESEDNFQSRKIETTEKYPKVSKIYAEKTEAMPQEDFQNKKIKASKTEPTVSDAEEMLLEDQQYRAILDHEDAKFRSLHEGEYMEQPIDDKKMEEKYELKPDSEAELNKELKTLMTKGQTEESPVNYKGNDPYVKGRKTFPNESFEPTDLTNLQEKEHKMRKKIVVRPSFHPPINPRVRIPRPPFDVRDHEYHTVNYRPPPDLLRHASLPLRRVPVAYQAKQVAASNVVKLPRPVMRLPSSVMRSSVLAVEVGLFAAFFTRYRGGCK